MDSMGLPLQGVCESVPSDLFLGWTVHYNEPYCKATRAEDFDAVPLGATMLIAAIVEGTKTVGTFEVAAVASREAALCHTGRKAVQHNGAWWYFDPGKAFGFAADADIERHRGGADTAHGGERLSWHLDGNGGYRAGWTEHLNADNVWRKVALYCGPVSELAKGLECILLLNSPCLGPSVEIQTEGIVFVVHRSILWCRAPRLYLRIVEQGHGTIQLCFSSAVTVRDFVRFLYCARLPWDDPCTGNIIAATTDELLQRTATLADLADWAEVQPLARICRAWHHLHSHNDRLHRGEGAAVGFWDNGIKQGSILGQGCAGAVLEEDVSGLLDCCTEPPDCILVLGTSCGNIEDLNSNGITSSVEAGGGNYPPRVAAHSVILAARSGFFEAVLTSNMTEKRTGIVCLGIIEELGLWRPGDLDVHIVGAVHSLLRFLYSCRTDHVRAVHAIDLLVLLQGNFLQIPDCDVLCSACKAALDTDLTLEEAAIVASRANAVGHAQARKHALERIATLVCHGAEPHAVLRQAVAGFQQELLLDLVEGIALQAVATKSVP
mmetsp:Transcript_118905/g.236946  ORF Transcript_118905/g.236946 Transcript_118905/m.236946 type:complete len:550 (-) Transcript_118905:198-1847(-)